MVAVREKRKTWRTLFNWQKQTLRATFVKDLQVNFFVLFQADLRRTTDRGAGWFSGNTTGGGTDVGLPYMGDWNRCNSGDDLEFSCLRIGGSCRTAVAVILWSTARSSAFAINEVSLTASVFAVTQKCVAGSDGEVITSTSCCM